MLRWLLLVGLLAAPLPAAAQETVYRIPVSGVIENGLAPYIARALREAAEARAVAVVLDLDTPGGRVDAAERIVDAARGFARAGLRLRQSAGLQRRRHDRPGHQGHLHEPGRRDGDGAVLGITNLFRVFSIKRAESTCKS